MKVMISTAAVPLSVVRPYMKTWDRKGLGVQALNRFNKGPKKFRIYMPIKARKQVVKPPLTVKRAVEAAGYKIEDYVLGIASKDGGARKIKIGKILPENLKQLFANDKNRAAYKDEYVCVISCHPYDIVGMSTGRRWDKTSCMRIGHKGNNYDDGAYSETIENDVAEGTLVAYAIRPSDENINNPIARLLIKPFYSLDGSGNILFRVETTVYGTRVPGFTETVSKWLKKINRGVKHGVYVLTAGLYDDGVGASIINAPYDEFKDDDARADFIQKMPGKKMRVVKSDPRWVDLIMQIESDSVPNLTNAIVEAVSFDVPASYISKAIDNATLDEYVDEVGTFVLSEISPGAPYLDILNGSKLLRKWAREKYRYSPKHSLSTFDIRLGMAVDSRWIREWKLDDAKFNYVLRGSLNGAVKVDKWLLQPKNEIGRKLLSYLQLIAALLDGRKMKQEPNRYSLRAALACEKLLGVGLEPKLAFFGEEEGSYFIRNVLSNLTNGFDCGDIAKQLIRFDERWIDSYCVVPRHLAFEAMTAPEILPLFEKSERRIEVALDKLNNNIIKARSEHELFKFPIDAALSYIDNVKGSIEKGHEQDVTMKEFLNEYEELVGLGVFKKRDKSVGGKAMTD